MIKRLRVKNFKALRDIEMELTPIHVLIGPNDSGKTSILEVLAALCRSVDHKLSEAFLGSWKGAELVWKGNPHVPVRIELDFENEIITSYGIEVLFKTQTKGADANKELIIANKGSSSDILPFRSDQTWVKYVHDVPSELNQQQHHEKLGQVYQILSCGVHYYHFNPSYLALPVALDSKRRFRMESDGFGLALLLDEILSFDRKRFDQLETRFIEIFPEIQSIKLLQAEAFRAPIDNSEQVTMLNKADGKGIYFQLKDSGQLIPASQASDGILLGLAYISVLYIPEHEQPRLLLIEEPENGIHPRRLRDILEILHKLVMEQSHTQVVLTTHSPYVLDLFKPEEVTLCTKLDNGEIKTTRLSDSPAVKKQLDVFTLGEIWTSEGDEKIADSKVQSEGLKE
ncbi:MAG: AAA family ATPase [Sedimentisphaerales bacterium]|nr:AAA family ATPase [Sedimentisphaerales bacterium]